MDVLSKRQQSSKEKKKVCCSERQYKERGIKEKIQHTSKREKKPTRTDSAILALLQKDPVFVRMVEIDEPIQNAARTHTKSKTQRTSHTKKNVCISFFFYGLSRQEIVHLLFLVNTLGDYSRRGRVEENKCKGGAECRAREA